MIEHIGNKTPFERKLNIVASNGYFKKKQTEYKQSNIAVTQILAVTVLDDWTLKHIEQRDGIVVADILQSLESWRRDYHSE